MAVKINMESNVKKATRDSYGQALAELGKDHEDIVVLDADLAETTKTILFKNLLLLKKKKIIFIKK